MAIVVKFYNENGNVSVKARDGIRSQVMSKMNDILSANLDGVVKNANGGYSVPIAIDEKTNAPIYAVIDVSISTVDPMAKKERKKSSSKAQSTETVVPQLF